MKDVTYSVKLDEELKKKITQFVKESGVTGKEFFAELLEMYELEKRNEGNSYAAELKELDDHLKRVRILCRGLVDETKIEIESVKSDFQRKVEKEKERSESLLHENEELREKVKKLSSELKTMERKNSDLQHELERFKNSSKIQEDLIKEYKNKLETMKTEIENAKSLEQENEKMKEALQDMKGYVESLQREKELLKVKIESLQTTIEGLRKSHSSEIETLKSKGEYERETAVAKERQRCQEKLEKVMNEYAKREAELSNTIRALYAQVDTLRETLSKEKSKKKGKNSR